MFINSGKFLKLFYTFSLSFLVLSQLMILGSLILYIKYLWYLSSIMYICILFYWNFSQFILKSSFASIFLLSCLTSSSSYCMHISNISPFLEYLTFDSCFIKKIYSSISLSDITSCPLNFSFVLLDFPFLLIMVV